MAPTPRAAMHLAPTNTFVAVLPAPTESTEDTPAADPPASVSAAPKTAPAPALEDPSPSVAAARRATPLNVLGELLSGRDRLEARLQHLPADGKPLIMALFGLGATGSCIFGAAVGMSGGAVGMSLVAGKLTLAAIATIAMSGPALNATRRVTTGEGHLTRELVRLLAVFARASVVLAALAPLVLLAVSWELTATQQHMLAFACCGVAGGSAASLLSLGTRDLSRTQRYLLGGSGAITIALLWLQVIATIDLFV